VRAAWALSRSPGGTGDAQPEPEQYGRLEQLQLLLASVAFVGTFVSIIVEVLARFLLDRPQVWSLELPTYLFLWSFSLAAGLSDWRDDQIAFRLLADVLPRKVRLMGSALANLLIAGLLAIALPGTVSYLQLIAQQPNTGLPGTEVWGYAGVFLLFAIAVLLRGRLLVREVGQLLRPGPGGSAR
jgi:TRAP-type C4-dicarboxylate transport system permease small subunit